MQNGTGTIIAIRDIRFGWFGSRRSGSLPCESAIWNCVSTAVREGRKPFLRAILRVPGILGASKTAVAAAALATVLSPVHASAQETKEPRPAQKSDAQKSSIALDHDSDPLGRYLGGQGIELTESGLTEAIRTHDLELIRALSAMLLARYGYTASASTLIATARNDPSAMVRQRAAESACRLGAARCLPCARDGLEAAPDSKSRLIWASILANHGDPETGVTTFLEILKQPEHRLEAIDQTTGFLGVEYPGFDPVALLLEWLGSDSARERATAVGEIRLGLRMKAIPVEMVKGKLHDLLEDDDPDIRKQALEALEIGRDLEAADRRR